MNEVNRYSHEDNPLEAICSCCHGEHSSVGNDVADSLNNVPLPEDIKISRISIRNMDCPTEERIIRNALGSLIGINRLDFNLLERELTVYHSMENTGGIISLLNAIDMSPLELSKNRPQKSDLTISSLLGGSWWLLGLSGAAAVGSEIISWVTWKESSPIIIALAIVSIFAGGLPTLKKGWTALKNLSININFLMSVAERPKGDVGIAMGAASSDIAIEAAHVVLMRVNPARPPNRVGLT